MQDLSQYAKRTHLEIQTKYLSFIVFVSIALVGLVFTLGVLVGSRNPAENNGKRTDALAVLDSRSSEPPPPEIGEKTKMTFHDSLGKSAPTVPSLPSLESKSVGPKESKKEAVKPQPVSATVAPRLTEKPIPENVPQDEPGIYSLQVGSFQTKREANQMLRILKEAGYGVFIVSVDMPDRGGTWYRVRVGPYHSKKEVWDSKRAFEQNEQIPAFVVKRRAKG